jgi:hypothetical protein
MDFQAPEDTDIPARVKGLLGLLDNPTIQPSKDSSIQLPKSKGLLGLLDGTSPTIQ